jgi:hypothetical protein
VLAIIACAWIGLVGLVVLATVVIPQASVPGAAGPGGGEPSATTPDGLAGQVSGLVSIQETFDDLPVDATLPAPWRLSREGAARVVAVPTSVDRSALLATDATGAAGEACRPTGTHPGAIRIALDYRLGGISPRQVTIVELRNGATPVLRLIVTADGRVEAVASQELHEDTPSVGAAPSSVSSSADPTGWRSVELTIASTGQAAWESREVSGGDAGSGTLDLLAGSRSPDTLCLRSPPGSPAAWVAVDNLRIEE